MNGYNTQMTRKRENYLCGSNLNTLKIYILKEKEEGSLLETVGDKEINFEIQSQVP